MIRDENKENNLADKVADKLFFYQTNEKITGQAFSWSSTASCFIFEQPFTKHSLLVCPVLFECFDHNRSRSTSNPCCCHISTRVCLLSILLWTPNPCFFSYVSWKEVAQLDLCLLTALTLLLVIVMHGTVCYSHFLFLHLHSHLSFFGCPFFIIILSF